MRSPTEASTPLCMETTTRESNLPRMQQTHGPASGPVLLRLLTAGVSRSAIRSRRASLRRVRQTHGADGPTVPVVPGVRVPSAPSAPREEMQACRGRWLADREAGLSHPAPHHHRRYPPPLLPSRRSHTAPPHHPGGPPPHHRHPRRSNGIFSLCLTAPLSNLPSPIPYPPRVCISRCGSALSPSI